MPWCESCSRFYNPNSIAPDGTCVKCGEHIADPPSTDDEDTKVPWHFWILVAALVVYLAWRAVQMISWIV